MERLLEPQIDEDLGGRFRLLLRIELEAELLGGVTGAHQQDLRALVIEEIGRVERDEVASPKAVLERPVEPGSAAGIKFCAGHRVGLRILDHDDIAGFGDDVQCLLHLTGCGGNSRA